jgi:hypothetical protein
MAKDGYVNRKICGKLREAKRLNHKGHEETQRRSGNSVIGNAFTNEESENLLPDQKTVFHGLVAGRQPESNRPCSVQQNHFCRSLSSCSFVSFVVKVL